MNGGVRQPVRLLDENEWKRVRDGYGEVAPFFDKESDFEITSPRGRERSGARAT